MRRPTGVTILAILALIAGVVHLCGGTVGLVGSGLGGIATLLGFSNLHPGALFVGSVLALVIGVLNLAFGAGALQLKSWAWPLGVGLEAFALIENIVSFIQGNGRFGSLIGIVIAAIILAYLFSDTVRTAFTQRRTVMPTTRGYQ